MALAFNLVYRGWREIPRQNVARLEVNMKDHALQAWDGIRLVEVCYGEGCHTIRGL